MKRFLIALAVISVLSASAYGLWRSAQPVQVDAVHKTNYFSHILVTHFPLTDHGRIEWWENNRARLLAKYDVPETNADGSFSVLFWAWDGVYRVDGSVYGDSDLFCFKDIPEEARCIIKSDQPLKVDRLENGSFLYDTGRDFRTFYYRKMEGAKLELRHWSLDD
jgi:Enterobacterial putative membrane protein (DUF943)